MTRNIRVGFFQIVGSTLSHLMSELRQTKTGKTPIEQAAWIIDFAVAHHVDLRCRHGVSLTRIM